MLAGWRMREQISFTAEISLFNMPSFSGLFASVGISLSSFHFRSILLYHISILSGSPSSSRSACLPEDLKEVSLESPFSGAVFGRKVFPSFPRFSEGDHFRKSCVAYVRFPDEEERKSVEQNLLQKVFAISSFTYALFQARAHNG